MTKYLLYGIYLDGRQVHYLAQTVYIERSLRLNLLGRNIEHSQGIQSKRTDLRRVRDHRRDVLRRTDQRLGFADRSRIRHSQSRVQFSYDCRVQDSRRGAART